MLHALLLSVDFLLNKKQHIRGPTLRSKQGCKDQELIQSSTTPDPEYQWESDTLTFRPDTHDETFLCNFCLQLLCV